MLPARFWAFSLNRVYTLSAQRAGLVLYAWTMAREDCSERGLPSPEVRRQILKHAGTVLNEARDLVSRLDLHETSYPRSVRENQSVLDRGRRSRVFASAPSEVPPLT